MIWYFLAGMIAGAVGFAKIVTYLGEKFRRQEQMKAFRRDNDDGEGV